MTRSSIRCFLHFLCALSAFGSAVIAAKGSTLDFSAGFAGSGMTLNFNGSAQIASNGVNTVARITNGGTSQAGTVWSKNQIEIHDFTSQFTFQITSTSGFADGFTFAIQRDGNTAVGGSGGSMGYHGIDKCVVLKFGTYPTTRNTTGIYAYGAGTSDQPTVSFDMTGAGINLHNGHVFSVALSYNSATFTLHQVVTDTSNNATFTHDYTIDLIAAIGGTRAYVGFTGSTAGQTATHDILTWSYSATTDLYSAAFSAYPNYLQLFPRNRMTNTATLQVAGTESAGGFSQAVLRVYRNGAQVGADQLQALSYSGGTAPFSFSATIMAELAEYDVELLFRNGLGQNFSVRRTTNIVAGDVFIIEGQSNATTVPISGNADAYISPFIRTFGLGTADTDGAFTYRSWFVANGGGSSGVGSLDSVGGVGQWGLVMGNLLMSNNNVPVAIMNGGNGGQPISFFQRNDASPTDILTNYGRLLYRMQNGGLASAVRSILYYQGEADNGQGAQYQAGYTALYNDWSQDYPSIERFYVFQERETNPVSPCGTYVARGDVDLRNRQRLFADQFANLSVMSSNGLDGYDGCHFAFTNGYETIGFNMARVLQRDLYAGTSLPSTDAPNPARALLTGVNKNVIRIPLRNKTDSITFDAGAKADFSVGGAAVSVSSGSVANGILQLNLSGNAPSATSVTYQGHGGPASGNWVKNANGIGLLCFIEPLVVDTTPPVITLLGANPFTVNQGGTYTDPGATATDNIDGDLSSSIVINASAVNTLMPGDYPVTYNVSDISDNAATQVTRTVHVNPNGSPTANPQSVTTNEDTAVAITLTGSDPEGGELTFNVLTTPIHGVLSGTAPNLTYTPAANYNGLDSFTFKTNDGTTNSNTATVSITVNAVNDPPTADSQSVVTNEDTAKAITLTGSDSDGDPLSYMVVTNPTHGALSGTAPNLTYTPAADYNGPDSFTFKVSDGMLESNVATVSITVNPVNDAPTISDVADTAIDEDTNTGAIDFIVGDAETAPSSLTVSGTSSNTTLVPNGNIVFGGSGANRTITITPAANANGTTTITVTVNDGTATTSDTFMLTVNAVNDAPTADGQSVTTTQNTSLLITLTGSDFETPSGSLTFNVTVPPAHGTLTGTAPNVTYNPTTDYHGPDSFKFTVTDTGDGASPPLTSAEATVSITINGTPEIAVEQPTGNDLSDGASTVDFGDVSVDDDNSHTFTIRNLGTAALTGLGITIDGTNADEFTITSGPTAPIGPGGSTTFTIRFSPAALDARTAALHIGSNDADENPFDIALTGAGITHLEAWRLQYFGSTEDTGTGADENDPDFDGLSNLLEFATGNDPEQSSRMPGTLSLNGNTIEFVYKRATGAMADGLTFNVEWSDDLTSPSWNSAGVTEEVLSDDGEIQTVKASVSAGTGSRRFLRLNVIRP